MTSLIHRKARTGREARAARAMSLGRSLRLTAAKQADQLMGLALGTLSVTQKTLPAAEIATQLLPDALMLLMDGPGEQVAAVVLEAELVAGLIQQQTMGNVTAAPEQGAQRPNTATDAAMCAPFTEALLSRAALMPEQQHERDLLQGYRFGVWASTPRQVLLALEADSYETIEMTLDLAAGTRAGKLILLLPEPMRGRATADVPDDDTAEAPTPLPDVRLDKHVMELHAELMIALTQLKMPLQQVSEMKVGDLVDIDISSMAQAIVIDTGGRIVTRGTLGQIDGVRALQVEQQKAKQYTQPRRRASDRDELDLPDVTEQVGMRSDDVVAAFPDVESDMPRMSDVDIFGDIDDLAEMPDIDALTALADANLDARDSAAEGFDDTEESREANQAGW